MARPFGCPNGSPTDATVTDVCRPGTLSRCETISASAVTTMFLFGAVAVAAGITFQCTPTHVWDGDGPIWCAEGPKIRLAGIAAREMDGTCRPGHPCPNASPIASRDHLVRLLGGARGLGPHGHVLVRGPVLTCQSMGSGKGDRTAAWCSTGRMNLSCEMVRRGYAARWQVYWDERRC